MPTILILNGPNLNLLGTREPEIYGSDTLQDVENLCTETANKHGLSVDSIHDALKMLSCPIIEVHFSDPETREEFRHHSYITPLATKIIKGHGKDGYRQAIEFLAKHINR